MVNFSSLNDFFESDYFFESVETNEYISSHSTNVYKIHLEHNNFCVELLTHDSLIEKITKHNNNYYMKFAGYINGYYDTYELHDSCLILDNNKYVVYSVKIHKTNKTKPTFYDLFFCDKDVKQVTIDGIYFYQSNELYLVDIDTDDVYTLKGLNNINYNSFDIISGTFRLSFYLQHKVCNFKFSKALPNNNLIVIVNSNKDLKFNIYALKN